MNLNYGKSINLRLETDITCVVVWDRDVLARVFVSCVFVEVLTSVVGDTVGGATELLPGINLSKFILFLNYFVTDNYSKLRYSKKYIAIHYFSKKRHNKISVISNLVVRIRADISTVFHYEVLLYDWYTKMYNNPNRRVQISCVIVQFEIRLSWF